MFSKFIVLSTTSAPSSSFTKMIHPSFSIRFVPVAIIIMNWFFLPSYEQVLAPRKGNDQNDGLHLDKKAHKAGKNQLFSKFTHFDEPFHSHNRLSIKRDKKMDFVTKWSFPSSSNPSKRDKLIENMAKLHMPSDLSSFTKRQSASTDSSFWHYPTAMTGNSKRTSHTKKKLRSSSKEQSSSTDLHSIPITSFSERNSKSSPLKRVLDPKASLWHFPTQSNPVLTRKDIHKVSKSDASLPKEHFPSPWVPRTKEKRANLDKSKQRTNFSNKRTLSKTPGKKRFFNFLPGTSFCLPLKGSDEKASSAFIRSDLLSSSKYNLKNRPWRFVDNVGTRSIDQANDGTHSSSINKNLN